VRHKKKATLLRQRTVEPSDSMLQLASLPGVSSTDLIISVEYAPPSAGYMKRRIFFPNHVTSPKDLCITVGSALQDPASLQIAPPRIPASLIKAGGLNSGNLLPLMESLHPDSKEFKYLDAWRRTSDNGDDFDLQSHQFTDAECVQGWAILLGGETQAYKPIQREGTVGEGRFVTLRLNFAHPMLMEAARRTFVEHAERILEADQSRPSGSTSPTPSMASTCSNSSNSTDLPASIPSVSTAHKAPLSRCASLSKVTVSPFEIRYICTSVTNWPREHSTEICGGNDQLKAFLHLHAPDLRILITEQFGSTDLSTTVICQQQHLTQLVNLQGKVSPEHGISTPLNLHCNVQLMGAQTCTFCWAPGHGAGRCPHRSTATKPVLPVSSRPACRLCYSFDHHPSACRASGPIQCKICEVQGHATHACSHFKPSKKPLAAFLKPHAPQVPHSAQKQAAPILSAAQVSSARAWQNNSGVAAVMSSSATSSVPSALYVTIEEFHRALHPMATALQDLISRLAPFISTIAASQPTSARINPVFSSPIVLNGQ
jgi:hypothetical protein